MKCYAGIGSREITADELANILDVAAELASPACGFTCYSGNAGGADAAFQTGSGGKCVIFLPWAGFNVAVYDPSKSLAAVVAGNTKKGRSSVDQFHPLPAALTLGARSMMARNYHQVVGFESWPQVRFVVCCATPVEGKDRVKGGTGQAVRVAESLKIPVVNLRVAGWESQLTELVRAEEGRP